MISLRKIYAAAAALGFAATASAIEIHVSPAGNDSNPGTREAPVATLRAAQQCVRHYKSIWHQPETITVVIAAGNRTIRSSGRLRPVPGFRCAGA